MTFVIVVNCYGRVVNNLSGIISEYIPFIFYGKIKNAVPNSGIRFFESQYPIVVINSVKSLKL